MSYNHFYLRVGKDCNEHVEGQQMHVITIPNWRAFRISEEIKLKLPNNNHCDLFYYNLSNNPHGFTYEMGFQNM